MSLGGRLTGAIPAASAAYRLMRAMLTPLKARRLVKSGAIVKLDIGAGNVRGRDGWHTVDMAPRCDLVWDLRRGIPFADGSVSAVYSSHFLEHLEFGQIRAFLQECRRVLTPGGEFLVCVPDARIYLDAYSQGRLPEKSVFLGHAPAYNDTTLIDAVNYIAYMAGEHKYMFDQDNLLHVLEEAGFQDVKPRVFDPALDRPDRDVQSIYASAKR